MNLVLKGEEKRGTAGMGQFGWFKEQKNEKKKNNKATTKKRW